jgi:hypothetical protein
MQKIYLLFILSLMAFSCFSQQKYKVTYGQLKEFEGLYEYAYNSTLKIATSPKDTLIYAVINQRWPRLMIYATDEKLNIDYNPVEDCIRPVAIGRKNYLFAGSHEAAQRSAMLYSLMGTCKLHDINPFSWLKNVLEIIPSHSINQIRQLLPYNWKLQETNSGLTKNQ